MSGFFKIRNCLKCLSCRFRIVSYNILSNRYAKSDYYGYCPLEFLAIEYRRTVLVDEIVGKLVL